MTIRFARRMNNVHTSTIREILKVTEQPEIISFAGGLPAPELFPVDNVLSATERVLRETGASALQYSPARALLRCGRAWRLSPAGGIDCSAEDILITTGSQQPLDLAGKIFLDAGDCVLTESPTYMAAIQAFQTYEVRFATVPTDDQGLIRRSCRLDRARKAQVPLYDSEFSESHWRDAHRGAPQNSLFDRGSLWIDCYRGRSLWACVTRGRRFLRSSRWTRKGLSFISAPFQKHCARSQDWLGGCVPRRFAQADDRQAGGRSAYVEPGPAHRSSLPDGLRQRAPTSSASGKPTENATRSWTSRWARPCLRDSSGHIRREGCSSG
jgi:hypothetical protein